MVDLNNLLCIFFLPFQKNVLLELMAWNLKHLGRKNRRDPNGVGEAERQMYSR